MRHFRLTLVALAAAAASACSDTTPQGPSDAPNPLTVQSTFTCPAGTIPKLADALKGKATDLYLPGAIRGSAVSRVDAISTLVKKGKTNEARAAMFELVSYTLERFADGKLTPVDTAEKLQEFINLLYCFVGLTPPDIPGEAFGPDGAVGVVGPSSPATVILTGSKLAGVEIPAGAAPVLTTIAIVPVAGPFPYSQGPILTDFDQFPLFYDYTASPDVTFNSAVTVGICTVDNTTTFANLKMAHNVAPAAAKGDFEVLPKVVPSFLTLTDCAAAGPGPSGPPIFLQKGSIGTRSAGFTQLAVSGLNAFARSLAPVARAVFVPKPLFATTVAQCCLGGLTTKFSPFGAVDTTGVMDSVPGAGTTGPAGFPVTPAPTIAVVNGSNEPMAGVAVTFTVTGGGGSVSPAIVLTDANGHASANWTLGAAPGVNTLSASAAYGGVAMQGGPIVFTATGTIFVP